MNPKKLYKTTIVIWSEYPTDEVSIEALGCYATSGDAYCSDQKCEEVTDPAQFPDTEFFNMEEDEDDDSYGGEGVYCEGEPEEDA